MAMSHENCTHPRTPAGRSACRRATDAGGTTFLAYTNPMPLAQSARIINDLRSEGAMETKMTGPVARRMARQAARADMVRPQPRRSGARVSTRNSSCVQAALHIDAHGGRCACGWEAVA